MANLPRIIIVSTLVLSVGAFGYLARSAWVILPLAVIFAVAFGIGRWRAWAQITTLGAFRQALAEQGGVLVIQAIVVTLLFLIGRGLGALVQPGALPVPWQTGDVQAVGALATAVAISGLMLIRTEQRIVLPNPPASAAHKREGQPDKGQLPPLVQLTEIFNGPHGSHYGMSNEVTIELTRVAKADIEAHEVRLGVQFPEVLRRLYLIQNGGEAEYMAIAPSSAQTGQSGETLVYPFVSGALCPIEALTGLVEFWDIAFQAADIAELFGPPRPPVPDGAGQMIVLSHWPGQVLMMDLRESGLSPVGLCKLYYDSGPQEPRWHSEGLWWKDAATFFGNLRRSTA